MKLEAALERAKEALADRQEQQQWHDPKLVADALTDLIGAVEKAEIGWTTQFWTENEHSQKRLSYKQEGTLYFSPDSGGE